MELTDKSTIKDILNQDLPRTKIFRDIHQQIIDAGIEHEKKIGIRLLDPIKQSLENYPLKIVEGYFMSWVYESDLFSKTHTSPEETMMFVYGLLLPYYVSSKKFHLDFPYSDQKQISDHFRPPKPLGIDTYPHPVALHHAHMAKAIIIKTLEGFESYKNGKKGEYAQLKKDKTRTEKKYKRIFFQDAYYELKPLYPKLTNVELHEKILEHLAVTHPKYEYTSDISLSKWIGRLQRGEQIYNTTPPAQIASATLEITNYISQEKNNLAP